MFCLGRAEEQPEGPRTHQSLQSARLGHDHYANAPATDHYAMQSHRGDGPTSSRSASGNSLREASPQNFDIVPESLDLKKRIEACEGCLTNLGQDWTKRIEQVEKHFQEELTKRIGQLEQYFRDMRAATPAHSGTGAPDTTSLTHSTTPAQSGIGNQGATPLTHATLEKHHSEGASKKALLTELENLKKEFHALGNPKLDIQYLRERLEEHIDIMEQTANDFRQQFADCKLTMDNFRITQENMCAAVVPPSLLSPTGDNDEDGNFAKKSSIKDSGNPATIDHLAEEHVVYELGDSTWDVGCFMFVHCLGHGASTQKFVLLIFTILFQLFFCIICNINFTQSDFPDDLVESMREFRLNVAHDFRYTNSVTGETFAAHLCGRGMGLELGATQLATLQNVDGYLGQDGSSLFEQIFAGTFMSCLALSCWCMTVLTELREILNFSCALRWLPIAPLTSVCVDDDEHKFEIVALSQSRRIHIIVIISVRIFLQCFLLYLGGMFLATESNVANLLLNTIALEFVVHVDHLVFDCFAADTSKSFVKRMKPLKVHTWRTKIGVDTKSILLSIFVIVYTLCFYLVVVVPMTKNMTSVVSALCDGTLHFAFAPDSYGFLYLDAFDAESPYARISKQTMRRAITMPISEINSPATKYEFATNPVLMGYSLSEMKALGTNQLVDLYNLNCNDLLKFSSQSSVFDFLAYVRITISPHINTCNDMAYACFEHTLIGNTARWTCPRTCRCDTPFSPTHSVLSRAGCPTACTKTPEYESNLSLAVCEDWTLATLQASPFFANWTNFLKAHSHTLKYGEELEQKGCAALSGPSAMTNAQKFCDASFLAPFAVRPLAVVCPEACQCTAPFNEFNFSARESVCPGTCNITRTT